eukprot:g2700.t1
MSSMYSQSQACRTEAEYAFTLKKPLVPVKVQDFTPRGWLGALVGSKLYFDIFMSCNLIGWLGALVGSKLYFDFSKRPFQEVVMEMLREVRRARRVVRLVCVPRLLPSSVENQCTRSANGSANRNSKAASTFQANQIAGAQLVDVACWVCDSGVQHRLLFDPTTYLQQLVPDALSLLQLITTLRLLLS